MTLGFAVPGHTSLRLLQQEDINRRITLVGSSGDRTLYGLSLNKLLKFQTLDQDGIMQDQKYKVLSSQESPPIELFSWSQVVAHVALLVLFMCASNFLAQSP